MSKLEIKDDLWALVEPLLPPHPPRLNGGRPRLSDRAALNGIVFVLRTGIGWEHLPQQLNYGSGDLLAPVTRLAGQRGLESPASGVAGAPAQL